MVIQASISATKETSKNRLFIVLYSKDGEHWKLKSEIMWLKDRIEKYMIGFQSRPT